MSNSYFQFKQFRIEQGHCAMKVSTDACIQGAWVPVDGQVRHVLDIGCGTGLLSLMLAQRFLHVHIDAIELDAAAARQAADNVHTSPWEDRIQVLQADARDFTPNKKYDFIICNPPFFHNSLLGPGRQRNQVRHTLSLGYEDLFQCIQANLSPEGSAAVLLPVAEHMVWEKLLTGSGWHITRQLLVAPRAGSAPNRVVSLCAREAIQPQIVEELAIRQHTGNDHTSEFIALLRPFYLHI